MTGAIHCIVHCEAIGMSKDLYTIAHTMNVIANILDAMAYRERYGDSIYEGQDSTFDTLGGALRRMAHDLMEMEDDNE